MQWNKVIQQQKISTVRFDRWYRVRTQNMCAHIVRVGGKKRTQKWQKCGSNKNLPNFLVGDIRCWLLNALAALLQFALTWLRLVFVVVMTGLVVSILALLFIVFAFTFANGAAFECVLCWFIGFVLFCVCSFGLAFILMDCIWCDSWVVCLFGCFCFVCFWFVCLFCFVLFIKRITYLLD